MLNSSMNEMYSFVTEEFSKLQFFSLVLLAHHLFIALNRKEVEKRQGQGRRW